MTKLLEKAFTEASRLPLAMQNMIAERLLEDINAEAKWDDSFAVSQDELSRLADEAVADFQNGKTKPLEEVLWNHTQAKNSGERLKSASPNPTLGA
jgi:predicted transcriptional regulator